MPVGIKIKFSKAKVQRFLDDMSNDRAIEPPADGWPADDLMALCGAVRYFLLTRCPDELTGRDVAGMHSERREATYMTFCAEVQAAIWHCSHLTRLVDQGEYDQDHEPELEYLVVTGPNGYSVTTVKGFRP
jgi:hypothetical protein